jgi:PP-loop superfamily ATP-utilizing enzyme
MKIQCSRCILDSDFPNIRFDDASVCNYCRDWDSVWKRFDYESSEQKMLKIIRSSIKDQNRYHCLIPFSGGRDSSYVAYLCKKKYGLNPLLVTFNNLFLSEAAISNIFGAVSLLGCDHLLLSYDPEALKTLYRGMVLEGGEFCSICTAGINYVVKEVQEKYRIPVVIWGTSSRVDEASPFEVTCTHPLYVSRALQQHGIPERDFSRFLIKRQSQWDLSDKIWAKLSGNDYVQINLPDYVPWKNEHIQRVLEEELDWVTPDHGADHIDCKFAAVKNYLKNKHIPHFIYKQEKFSQLIRDEQMSREDALGKLDTLVQREHQEPRELEEFMAFLELSRTDLERLGKVSHEDFISRQETLFKESPAHKVVSELWNLVKRLRSKG